MITIQANLLPGDTLQARFAAARDLGIEGVELWAETLLDSEDTLYDAAAAVDATGIPISGLFMGDLVGLLAADLPLRDRTIDRVRQALTDAHDLHIPHVTVVPQPAHAPSDHTSEQERELMIWFVRVVNDLAGAMDTRLHLLALEPKQARVLNTISHTYAALEEMRFHPWVAMSADAYSLHNSDSLENSSGMMPMLQQVYVHSPLTRLLDSADDLGHLLRQLHEAGFKGEFTISAGLPMRISAPALSLDVLRGFLAHITAEQR